MRRLHQVGQRIRLQTLQGDDRRGHHPIWALEVFDGLARTIDDAVCLDSHDGVADRSFAAGMADRRGRVGP